MTSAATVIATLPTGYVPIVLADVTAVSGNRNFLGTIRLIYEDNSYKLQIVLANATSYSGYVIGTLLVPIR